jgi:hypothetical protein
VWFIALAHWVFIPNHLEMKKQFCWQTGSVLIVMPVDLKLDVGL